MPLSLPGPPSLPKLNVAAVSRDVEMVEMDDTEAAQPVHAGAPHPATPAERQSWTDTRAVHRVILEIEVGIASQADAYVGLTENLSTNGVFVATYATPPIGAAVEISLAFSDGEKLAIRGIVRWLREATTDGWPGMGVQFEGVTPGDEAKIRKFLSLRDPLFYEG